jgi:peptidoglycan/xylan/chitin deacetylase (PgdA/CDA1 family)
MPSPFQLRTLLKSAAISSDAILAGLSLAVGSEQGSLLSFLFHGLFESSAESRSGVLAPQQGVTLDMFRAFLLYFRERSYRFVSPEDLAAGLPPAGRYVLITFDDGYYFHERALPVLEEFGVPAVFFISSDHVRHGKSFWWDVVFREFRKRGQSDLEFRQAIEGYKRLETAEVEADLMKHYGDSSMKPVGDLDRPFTPSELRDFASHRLVFLGNHTRDHAILTNYSPAEIKEQIEGGQDALGQMTGKVPAMIAYPNGNATAEIRKAAAEAGLSFGMSTQPGRNRLPVRSGEREALSMKRFTLWGNHGIEQQCRASRAGMSLHQFMRDLQAGYRPYFCR